MAQQVTEEQQRADEVFLRRGLLWFFVGLPFSIVTCAIAVNPIQLFFYVAGQGRVTRGAEAAGAIGLEILGFIVMALCIAYASALGVEYYFGNWKRIRKYVFHAWMGSFVATWLALMVR